MSEEVVSGMIRECTSGGAGAISPRHLRTYFEIRQIRPAD